nr:MAM and LDL-receptor class A domain-containing protein 1-like [Rhipicephalus microplus]
MAIVFSTIDYDQCNGHFFHCLRRSGPYGAHGQGADDVECDFEHGVCDFYSNCKGDDCFVPVQAKLADEGPAVDHTTGRGDGWYSRAQFSKNSWHESVAQLELSTMGPFCFSAWIHVSGLKLPRIEMASRQLDAEWYVDEAEKEHVFYQAYSFHPDLWHNVLYHEDRSGKMKIEIRTWHFTNGSVGVDDLSVMPGSCPEDPLDGSCSFDRSVCGYESVLDKSGTKWTRIPPGRSASRNKAVALDHTTDTIRGGYVSLLVPANTVASGMLTSPTLSASPDERSRCIRFFYFAPVPNSHSGLELLLSTGSTSASDEQGSDRRWLWGVGYSSLISGAWMPAEVDFVAPGNHELHFRCYVELPRNSSWYCALDDVEVHACTDKKGKELSCNFDGGHLCNWTSAPEPSGATGYWRLSHLRWGEPHIPDRDHTHGTSEGGFTYAENKHTDSVMKAVLTSSTWDASWVGSACLTFWHFAVFNQPGSCNLTVSPLSGKPWWSSTHELERAWKRELIRVWLPPDQNQFRLQASLRDALIAVDDITLAFGACPSEQRGLSCDFERGPCTWTNSMKKGRTWAWLLRGGQLNTRVPQPSVDHTLSSDKGSFMLVSGREMQVTGTAELQSEVVDLYAHGAQCMDFWYMVQGSQGAQITFKVTVNRQPPGTNQQMQEVWFHKGQNVTAWTLGRVKIPRRHRVTFQAAVLQSRNGYVALDDIAIYINDDCPTMPAEAAAGKTAYVMLDCVWNIKNRCSWSRPDEIAGTWKLGSRFPPKYALSPAASPAGKPSDFIYLSCKKLHSSGVMVSSSLDSPIVPLQQTVVCTRFAFHMFGPGKRELMLLLRTRQFQSSMQSRTRVLFRAFGGTVADRWYHVSRTIRFSAHTTTLSFSVSSDKCEQGDVALSNIHVTPGACLDYGGKERCDFEHDICDWHNNGWTHVVTGMTGDMADASLRSGPANSASLAKIDQALYVDGITICTSQRSVGRMKLFLQKAANIVDDCATYSALKVAPAKSAFMHRHSGNLTHGLRRLRRTCAHCATWSVSTGHSMLAPSLLAQLRAVPNSIVGQLLEVCDGVVADDPARRSRWPLPPRRALLRVNLHLPGVRSKHHTPLSAMTQEVAARTHGDLARRTQAFTGPAGWLYCDRLHKPSAWHGAKVPLAVFCILNNS